MSLIDVIVAMLAAGAVAFAIISAFKHKKSGGGCSGCPGCRHGSEESCPSREDD